MYICIYTHLSLSIYIYIYIERERETLYILHRGVVHKAKRVRDGSCFALKEINTKRSPASGEREGERERGRARERERERRERA